MSIATKSFDQITGTDVAALVGAAPDLQRIATLATWSREEAAVAAASLANTGGGLVIIGATADAAGKVTSIAGTNLSQPELAAAIDELGPAGRYLTRTRVVEAGPGRVALLKVAESPAPPVLVETSGLIYCRTDAGLAQVRTRAELDQLLVRERVARQRAEHNIEGMLDRFAFGHFNYMSVAVVAASRIITDAAYKWASENQALLVDTPFAKSWGLAQSDIQVRPGEVEVALPAEVTGIIRIARNGCVVVGERQVRPAQHVYTAPAALATKLAAMAEAAALPFQSAQAGPVLGALFLEGVRDLRLPVEGGTTLPASKDLVREFLSEYYLEGAGQRALLGQDALRAASAVFGADLIAGVGQAKPVPAKAQSPQPQNWHGLTKRTERRLAGLRGHGSGR